MKFHCQFICVFFLRCNAAQVYSVVHESRKEVNNSALTAAYFIGTRRFVSSLQSCRDTMLLLLFRIHIDLVCVLNMSFKVGLTKNHHFHVHHFDALFKSQNAPNSIP